MTDFKPVRPGLTLADVNRSNRIPRKVQDVGYEQRTYEIEKKVRRQIAAEKRQEEPKCWNCHKRKQHLQPFAPFCSTACESQYNAINNEVDP